MEGRFGTEGENEVKDTEAGDEAEFIGTYLPVGLRSGQTDCIRAQTCSVNLRRRNTEDITHGEHGGYVKVGHALTLSVLTRREEGCKPIVVKLKEWCTPVGRLQSHTVEVPPRTVGRYLDVAPRDT